MTTTAHADFDSVIQKNTRKFLTLNYTVTSNHTHLLVVDDKERGVIPNSIKLIAGRTGQEFNQRKNRKGAFREDRYHATAVEDGRSPVAVSCIH
jgi:hypothetical protein